MEQIEEGLFFAAAIFLFCFALSCLFTEQQILLKLGENIYKNYHQETVIEELWYE